MKKWLIKLAIRWIKQSNDIEAKNEILSEAVKELFNTIGPEDILRQRGKEWFYKDRTLTEVEVNMLKSEAKFFESSKLWSLIQNDIKYQLNRKMFLESNITVDVMWGKLILYMNDIINTRLKKLND